MQIKLNDYIAFGIKKKIHETKRSSHFVGDTKKNDFL